MIALEQLRQAVGCEEYAVTERLSIQNAGRFSVAAALAELSARLLTMGCFTR